MKSTIDVLLSFGTKLLLLPITLVVSIAVRRMLGPDGAGVYAFVILMISLATSMGSLGFGAGIQYFIASKAYTQREVIASSLFVSLLMSLAYGCLIYVLNQLGWLPPEARNPLVLLSIMLALFPSFAVFYATRHLMGLSAFAFLNGYHIIQALLPVSVLLMSVLLNLGLAGVLISVPVNFLLLMLISLLILIRWGWRWKVNFAFIRDCFSYGIRAWIGDLALRANMRVDQVLISATQPIAQLGFYTIAVQLTELIWYLGDSVGQVIQPRISGITNQEAIDLTNRMFRIVLLSTLLLVIGLAFAADPLIRLVYGDHFSEATHAVYALLPGSVGYLGAKIFSKYFAGRQQPGKVSMAQIVGSLVSVPLYVLLIPTLGIVGAGIASSIGYASASLVMWRLYQLENCSSVRDLLPHIRQDGQYVIKRIELLCARFRQPKARV